jgi:prevent-host-death family protein
MTSISVDDIARDLSGYLQRVQGGESLLITKHDEPVAELRPVTNAKSGSPDQLSTIHDYLKSRLSDARVPARWSQEGISDPTKDCRELSFRQADQLFQNRRLLPAKVVATRREGIYLEYKSPIGGRVLGIEVDNDLDVVAAVSDAEKVLASAAFEGDEAEELLRIFFGGVAKAAGDSRTSDA